MPEFLAVCLTCDSDTNVTVDVSVHVTRTASRLLLSLFSPYWIINKTSRVLQYRAEDVSVKHPADYRDIILFSFRKKNVFSKSKVRKRCVRLQAAANPNPNSNPVMFRVFSHIFLRTGDLMYRLTKLCYSNLCICIDNCV